MDKLIDPFHRRLNYLRISITDHCNLKCIYCKPDSLIPKLSHFEILTYEEILRVARVAANLGISKVRITGGEPLVRRDAIPFLERLSAIDGFKDISLTTNGIYLSQYLKRLKSIGIRRVNISLDTLKPKKFNAITGKDAFATVWQSIEKAIAEGFAPIKINVVALRGINDDEFTDFARLSLTLPLHIRFIEYMPIGQRQVDNERTIATSEIKARLATIGKLIPVKRSFLDGPAKRFHLPGAKGEIGFISSLSHHFCNSCNRLRLTASGELRPCLLSDVTENLKTPLRSGCSDHDLARIFLRAVIHKPSRHHILEKQEQTVKKQMSSIGG